jgi:hypothetical protein
VQDGGPRNAARHAPNEGEVARAWYAIINNINPDGSGIFKDVTFKVFALCASDNPA